VDASRDFSFEAVHQPAEAAEFLGSVGFPHTEDREVRASGRIELYVKAQSRVELRAGRESHPKLFSTGTAGSERKFYLPGILWRRP
jgi:hypothetical protein